MNRIFNLFGLLSTDVVNVLIQALDLEGLLVFLLTNFYGLGHQDKLDLIESKLTNAGMHWARAYEYITVPAINTNNCVMVHEYYFKLCTKILLLNNETHAYSMIKLTFDPHFKLNFPSEELYSQMQSNNICQMIINMIKKYLVPKYITNNIIGYLKVIIQNEVKPIPVSNFDDICVVIYKNGIEDYLVGGFYNYERHPHSAIRYSSLYPTHDWDDWDDYSVRFDVFDICDPANNITDNEEDNFDDIFEDVIAHDTDGKPLHFETYYEIDYDIFLYVYSCKALYILDDIIHMAKTNNFKILLTGLSKYTRSEEYLNVLEIDPNDFDNQAAYVTKYYNVRWH